ncbi:MAG: cytochrome C [Gammaproteobacteria bacterium]|nr:cytochrome C [Gammaproteobacteria bacterium]
MQHPYPVLIRLVIFILLLIPTSSVFADSLQSLLMPGAVIKAHEKYEQDCDQCHDTGNKERQGQLCVQCHAHENILDDLTDKKGFHGRLPSAAANDCKHCHTDHEGRNANIVLLNTATFDHAKTDFLLRGSHKKAACTACHKPEKKYAEAPAACYDCHKKSDIHDGKQGKKCGNCHKATNWKQTAFDHDKTDFPLKDAHKKTRCTACHINQKYKDTPKACISCHQINDTHRGSFGKKCDSCHTTKQWQKTRFDHNKKTDFPLFGKHKKASCNSCHSSGDLKKKLPKKCYGCHKNDDSHKGRYGKKCKNCHSSASWQKQKFDHSKASKFPLLGKHKKTTCNRCHKGELYKDKLKTACFDCHKKDDIHKGKQGKKCGSCHNAKGWHSNVLFDHDLSRFPLIGMHATTPCEECHLSAEYGSTESACNQCHASDDVHKTRLGTDCASCHNPNAWDAWLFDHDKASTFKIDGAHKKLGCYDCHQTTSNGKLQASKDCISCHRSRDIHNRLFGRQCGRCHSTKTFKDSNIKP